MKNSGHRPRPLKAGRVTGLSAGTLEALAEGRMIHLSCTKPPTLSSVSWCRYMYKEVLQVFICTNCHPAAQSFLPQSVSLSVVPLYTGFLYSVSGAVGFAQAWPLSKDASTQNLSVNTILLCSVLSMSLNFVLCCSVGNILSFQLYWPHIHRSH